MSWLSFADGAAPRRNTTTGINRPRRRASDSAARLEVVAVRCEDSHNLHVVTRNLAGQQDSELLVRGMTEQECRAALARCRDALAELFDPS